MTYDRELIAHKLRRWEKYLAAYKLPKWDELPTIGLYMEQVVALLGQWLYFLPAEDNDGDVVTPTAINNYVRLRIMPAPDKKKYSRIHIAYLIMICTLKQSISISYVQKIIPMGLTEDEVREVYSDYVEKHSHAADYFIELVRSNARPVLDGGSADEHSVNNLVTECTVLAGFARLMTEKIIKLQDQSYSDVVALESEHDPKTGVPKP